MKNFLRLAVVIGAVAFCATAVILGTQKAEKELAPPNIDTDNTALPPPFGLTVFCKYPQRTAEDKG